MAERRVFKPEEKMKIVMEGLSGTIEITELCRKYGIATSRFYDWKGKLVKNSSGIFDGRGRKNTSDQGVIVELRGEISRLKDVIAEITFENLEIKKKIGELLKWREKT
ncbi:MAG: transposase [Candidatus Thermoplasmatota archaeon]|nr:transposase [Candidatus Thermoplasmatota archaeon]